MRIGAALRAPPARARRRTRSPRATHPPRGRVCRTHRAVAAGDARRRRRSGVPPAQRHRALGRRTGRRRRRRLRAAGARMARPVRHVTRVDSGVSDHRRSTPRCMRHSSAGGRRGAATRDGAAAGPADDADGRALMQRPQFKSNREGSRTMMTKMKRLAIVAGSLALGVPFVACTGRRDRERRAGVGHAGRYRGLLKAVAGRTRTSRGRSRGARPVCVRRSRRRPCWPRRKRRAGTQAQVQAAVEQARREIVVRSYLASVNAPPADYPSDAELQSAYDKNRAAFTAPRALHVAQIYIAVPPNADAATLDKARKQAADLASRARWRFRGACKSEFAGQGECRERRRSRFRARSIDGAGGPSGGRRAEAGRSPRRSRRQRAFTS